MNLLKALLYGIVSGFTEILPVSSSGHQAVFRKILGDSVHYGMYNLFIHIGILIALLYSCKTLLRRLGRTRRAQGSNDRRVIKNATPSFVIASIVLMLTVPTNFNLIWVAAMFVLGGIVLFIPSCIATGNKDARSMSVLDSVLIGLSGALSVMPGLSRVGSMTTLVSVRGGDQRHGVAWALALGIPAMGVAIIADIYFAFDNNIPFYFNQFFCYLFAFAGAFCGCYTSTKILRKLAKAIGLSVLSYYCWGMAILTFILYLMV